MKTKCLSPDGQIALAITSCAGVRHKRYSGQQDEAPGKNLIETNGFYRRYFGYYIGRNQ
jgi:hypothetical protein